MNDQRGIRKYLVGAIEQKKSEVRKLETELWELENNHVHEWAEPKYELIKIEGHCEGYIGLYVGFQLKYIPGYTTPRWTRECKTCGKIQETKNSEKVCFDKPKFPGD